MKNINDIGMKKYLIMGVAVALTLVACSTKIELGDYSKVGKGDMVPDFTITDISGAFTYASRSAGVPVLIYLFWSECGDCKEATPAVLDVWEAIVDDSSVRLVCLARGGSEFATQEMAETYWNSLAGSISPSPMPPLYFDSDRSIFDKFASQGVPRFCVVDGNGIIRWHAEGVATYETLRGQLMSAKLPLADETEE